MWYAVDPNTHGTGVRPASGLLSNSGLSPRPLSTIAVYRTGVARSRAQRACRAKDEHSIESDRRPSPERLSPPLYVACGTALARALNAVYFLVFLPGLALDFFWIAEINGERVGQLEESDMNLSAFLMPTFQFAWSSKSPWMYAPTRVLPRLRLVTWAIWRTMYAHQATRLTVIWST